MSIVIKSADGGFIRHEGRTAEIVREGTFAGYAHVKVGGDEFDINTTHLVHQNTGFQLSYILSAYRGEDDKNLSYVERVEMACQRAVEDRAAQVEPKPAHKPGNPALGPVVIDGMGGISTLTCTVRRLLPDGHLGAVIAAFADMADAEFFALAVNRRTTR